MHKKIQILGTSPYLIGLIYDFIQEDGIAKQIWVYSNLEKDFQPQTPVKQIKIYLQKRGSAPSSDFPVIFGVSNSKNKIPVYEYFLKNFKIGKSHYSNLIHSSAKIAASSFLEKGVMIEQNVIISSQTKVGFGVSVKRGSLVGHHCILEDFVDINPGVVISGKVVIGEKSTIGSGCTIVDGVKIGKNTLIGAGSLVTRDIPENVVAYGSPCRIIRDNE